MAFDSETYLVTSSLALFITILGSSPAALSLRRHLFRESASGRQNGRPPAWLLYRDDDGQATQESHRRFSNRWQRLIIAFLSAAGLGVSLTSAIISTHRSGKEYVIVQGWLDFGIWILVSVQAFALCAELSHTRIYSLSNYTFWSSIIIVLTLSLNNWKNIRSVGAPDRSESASIWLPVAQISAALLQGVCCSLMPRRPNVFHEGKHVDQQNSVSLASRFTFTWASGLVRDIAQNRTLNSDDLPCLPSSVRSQILHARFEKRRGSCKLWKVIVMVHWRALVVQFVLSLLVCVLSFGPQVALYQVLKALQDRPLNSTEESQAWIWVATLGIVMLLTLTVDSWLWWVMYSELGLPIYEELATLVFAKSMRCKDIKPGAYSRLSQDNVAANGEANGEKESRQKVINLTAVDAKRISDCAAFIYLIPFSILKLIISCAFLMALIGWESLLAGLAAAALVMPVNFFLAKRFSNAQQRLMNASDKRIAIVAEVLKGIRHIKFSATEAQWQEKIYEKRSAELHWLWKAACYTTGLTAAWILGPLLLSAVSLTVYALIHGGLTAPIAFTAMSIFGSLEKSLADLPELLSRTLEAKISIERIDKYMGSPEKKCHASPSNIISFENATIAWPVEGMEHQRSNESADDPQGRFVLHDLNLSFPSRGLSLIAGKTASGKSLLLASIIGECDVLAGKVNVPCSPPETRFDLQVTPTNWIMDSAVAYVAQNPWMENATIRDNILFGLPYDQSRYGKVLFACRLEADLEVLVDGDLTDIGSNGINLSGGQRWRVSLARALYSRAGVLVLDDIFSALDAHTGRLVYEHALNGELGQGRTRILVTHHISLCLPRADYCVLLGEGSTKYVGPAEGLCSFKIPADITSRLQAAETEGDVSQSESADLIMDIAAPSNRLGTARGTEAPSLERSFTHKKFSEEKRTTGSIPLSLYTTYVKKGKHLPLWALAFSAYVVYTALLLGRSLWIKIWSGSSSAQGHPAHYPTIMMTTTVDHMADTKIHDDLFFYLGVYVAISLFTCVVGALRYFLLVLAALKSSRRMFEDLVYAVLRAPLHWLNTVPLGRILNRFTSDLYMMDVGLSGDLGNFVTKLLEFLNILAACIIISLPLTGIACLLLVFCVKLVLTFLTAAREIKRLESVVRSPMLELIDSCLAGLTTIRTYAKTDEYIRRMYLKIDRHAETLRNLWLLNRWLGYRLSVVGAIFSTATAAVAVYFPTISAAMAGLAMSVALQYNFTLTMTLRLYSRVELGMNATERVIEYCNTEIESQDGIDPPAAWPTQGRIEVCDLRVSYATDLPPVLDGLNFAVDESQRIGIVGRTGAGKSSLALALFRFLETRGGYITIDGLDISKIKLHALRSRLAIIPQDPMLFSGTTRSNLDPFDEHSDAELYHALEQVRLVPYKGVSCSGCSRIDQVINEIGRASLSSDAEASYNGNDDSESPPPSVSVSNSSRSPESPHNISKKPTSNAFVSLSTIVSEGGILSQGQRQLLCLARAVVSRPKILILDEATSAVDMETDAIMQRCIRTEFAREKGGTTLLVIAHRLSSVADFDRILVMDKGKAVEFGSPKELLEIRGGFFRNLVNHSGEKELLERVISGKNLPA